jgi:YidC/Oxa1 family membrane protein insertase
VRRSTLYPFALISRHGTPEVSGYYILHEGLIGYLGEKGLQEHGYKAVAEAPILGNGGRGFEFNVTNGWLGITDKYWAAALLPETTARLKARFLAEPAPKVRYQADYLQDPQTIAIGGTGSANARLFAGAKEAGVVGINFPLAGHGGYNKQLELNHFDLLDRLGLVLLHHQADVPGARLLLPPVRQFRRRHPAGDRCW